MKTRVDKRMTRILFAVAAAAAFLMAFGARTAQAAPIAVKSVNYNLTSEEPLVDPEKTENDVKVKITGLLTTDTEGVKIDTSNEFLEYWDSTYKQLNGVGTGSNMVFPLKQYYFCAGTELKPGYDWADEVKALPHMKETPVAQLKTFQVFVNGEVCDKAIICYNSAYNLIRVSFPIGNDLSKAKGELTENTFTYDGKVKDPEVKSLTLGTLEPDEDEYRLRYEDADGKKVWPIDAGTYYAAITGKGMYSGKVRLPFTINKAPNELEIKARTATVKYSAVSLKKQTVQTNLVMTTSTPCDHIINLAKKYDIPLYIKETGSDIRDDWNFAYNHARTPWVTIAHQDDLYDPHYVEELLAKIRVVPDAVAFVTDYIPIKHGVVGERDINSKIRHFLRTPLKSTALSRSKFWKRAVISLGNSICCPSVSYNKAVLGDSFFTSDLADLLQGSRRGHQHGVDQQPYSGTGRHGYVPKVLAQMDDQNPDAFL